MKTRTNFVTNSSSVNYILETIYAEKGIIELAVSEETVFSDDSYMPTGSINLVPANTNKKE